jgi:hypothetical protein
MSIENINENFKLPIFYNEKKIQLKSEIIIDLELVKTRDPSCNPIYNVAFEPKTKFAEEIIQQMQTYYTTDIRFLKDSQKLLSCYQKIDYLKNEYTDILEVWNEIKINNFKQKYYYLDWSCCEFLNKSEYFLQFMSLHSLGSPVLSFLIPIFILIMPFFIVKLKGLNVTINEYIEVLKLLASNHAIGRIFTHFNKVSMEQKIYIFISAIFYLISIYQNFVTCYKFNQNMKNIHKYLNYIKEYSNKTILIMNNFLQFSCKLKTYEKFNDSIKVNREILCELSDKITKITEYKFSMKKISEIGFILKCFYELYDDKKYNDTFLFSFGFNGYIDNIENLIQKINERQMNLASFRKNNKKKANIFKKSYYAPLINDKHVKNTIKLNKNIIITGPNASGKTTILKSTLINVIFTQQFGCGFYDSAKLYPYKYLHSYLNIPDTSGRDSLFQAEARRCKEIIDIIKLNPNDTHFCSFDELYSGTNPDESVISSLAFMEYLVKFKNIDSILTTHFITVCKKLQKNTNIMNFHMETIKSNNDFHYTYLLKTGISEIHGGIKVLTDMNYPKEIIDNTKNNLYNLE